MTSAVVKRAVARRANSFYRLVSVSELELSSVCFFSPVSSVNRTVLSSVSSSSDLAPVGQICSFI